MEIECGGLLLVDEFEEADPLAMAVPGHAGSDDAAFEHVDGGKQRGRSVALVVVGHRAQATWIERQAGLSAVERLDLALLVEAEDQSMLGRIEVEPDDVVELLEEVGIATHLERLGPVGGWAVGVPP